MAIVLLILGTLLGVVLTVLLQDPIEALAARVLGPIAPTRRGRSLQKSWVAYYELVGAGEGPRPSDEPIDPNSFERIYFRKIGSTVIGRNEIGSRTYRLRLKLRDNVILSG